ncbi:MAG: hypothetical protein MR503_10415 [Oscillospiraceae bacterium]|nr:hypothetical protein [Oscillospiraceae bacterium]
MRKNESKFFGKGSGEEPFLRKVCPSRVAYILPQIPIFTINLKGMI